MTVPEIATVALGPSRPRRPLLVLGPSLGTSVEGLWGLAAASLAEEFEVVGWEDLVAAGSWSRAREAATLRMEGKDYIVQEGDVIQVRFNV